MATKETKRILSIILNYGNSLNGLKSLNQEITALEKKRDKLAKKKNQTDADRKEIESLNIAIKALTQQYNTLSKEVLNATNADVAEAKAMQELTTKLDDARTKFAALSAEQQKNSKEGQELAATIRRLEEASNREGKASSYRKNKLAELKSQYAQLTDEQKKNSKEALELKNRIAALEKAEDREKKELKHLKQGFGESATSINGMRARLNELLMKWDSLSKVERKKDVEKIGKQIKQLTRDIKQAEEESGRFQRNVGNYGSVFKKVRNAVLQLGFGVLGVAQGMVLLGNTIKQMVENAIYFNRELSKIEAITGAAANDIDLLAAKAKELGATTRYTATQVAELQVELAKLGYTVPQITKMSEGVLYLAQATGTDLASAAKFTGAILRSFNLDVEHTMEVVDKVSQSTSKSALSFDYLVTSMQYVGATANTFGFKLEEILALLGTLANSGVEASMAGTASRNILLRLADANGKLARTIGKPVRNIHELSEALNDLMKRGMSLGDALELTDKRSVNAFTRIAMAGKDLEKLSQIIAESEGRAKRMAEVMENNLGGSLTRLQSKWQDLWLSLSGKQSGLKAFVDDVEWAVGRIGDIVRPEFENMSNEINKYIEQNTKKESETMQKYLEEDSVKFAKYVQEEIAEGYKGDAAIDRARVRLQDELREAQAEQEKAVVEYMEQIDKLQSKIGQTSWGQLKSFIENGDFRSVPYILAMQWRKSGLNDEVEKYMDMLKDPQIQAKLLEERAKNAESFGVEEYNKSGLGIAETDADRNKRLQNEKSAAKQLLEAQKALENSMLNLLLESAEKRKKALENQYNQEIQDLKYKIEETLKLRGDESEKERADKVAAADLYRQTIVKKQEKLAQELEKLEVAELSREIARAQEMYQLKLEGVEDNSEEEYKLRLDLLDKMMEAELNKLKEEALADEDIQKKSAEKKLDIEKKYQKQRKKVEEENRDNNRQKQIDEYQAKIIKASKDEIKAAKLTIEQKKYMLDNMVKQEGQSLEDFNLRRAEAEQDYLQSQGNLERLEMEAKMQLYENAILLSNSELERAKLNLEKQRDYVANMHQWADETDQAYAKRTAEEQAKLLQSEKTYSQARMQIAAATANEIAGSFGAIAEAIEACADENEKSVKAAKILGLAQIYIQQGVAIAEAIHQAWATSSNWIEAIAATATSITTVVSSTIQAIKSIKKAQFAKGVVDVQGPGTETSDSIDARISRGESVMTARATKMFKPLLAAMNGIAAQPNATLPTMYSTYNPSQVKADNQQFRDSMREALVDLHPVVSVEEINRVDKRLTTIKALDTI